MSQLEEDSYRDGDPDPRIPLVKTPDESVVKELLSSLGVVSECAENEDSKEGYMDEPGEEMSTTSENPKEDAIRSYGGLQKVSEVAHLLLQRPLELKNNERVQDKRTQITPICSSIKKEVNVLTMLFSRGHLEGVPKTTKEIAKHLNELTKVIRHINSQAMPQLKKHLVECGARVLCAIASLAEIGTNYGNPTLACGLVWDALGKMTTCPRTNGCAVAQEFESKLKLMEDARIEMTKELKSMTKEHGGNNLVEENKAGNELEVNDDYFDNEEFFDFSTTVLDGEDLKVAMKALNLIGLSCRVVDHITRFVRWLKGGNVKAIGKISYFLSQLHERVMKFDELVDNLVVEVMYDQGGEEANRAQDLKNALIDLVSCAQKSKHFSRRKMVIREGERSRKVLSPTEWLKNVMRLLENLDFSHASGGCNSSNEAVTSEGKSSDNTTLPVTEKIIEDKDVKCC